MSQIDVQMFLDRVLSDNYDSIGVSAGTSSSPSVDVLPNGEVGGHVLTKLHSVGVPGQHPTLAFAAHQVSAQ